MSNRATYQRYLLSKGLSPTQVGGILLNIQDESGFNPNPSGSNDNGMSYGLFQHYGPRRDALFRYAGTSSPTWQQQIDYALTEPDMARYLEQDYPSYGHAAVSFLDKFERPAKKHRDARAAKYMARHVAPDGYMIDASEIAGGPAYPGGEILPVSALLNEQTVNPQNPFPGMVGLPQINQAPSLTGQLASSPLFQMGMGILANNPNLFGGMQQGLLNAQRAEIAQQALGNRELDARMQMLRAGNELYELEEKRRQRTQEQEAASRQREQTELLAKRLEKAKRFDEAALVRAGLGSEVDFSQDFDTVEVYDPNLDADITYQRDSQTGKLKRLSPTVDPNIEKAPDLDKLKSIGPYYDRAQKDVKPFSDAARQARRLEVALANPGEFSDVQVIFDTIKTLDPGSVVRESESDLMTAALPVWDQLKQQLSRVTEGGIIPNALRLDIQNSMSRLMGLYAQDYQGVRDKWATFGEKWGLDPTVDLGVGFVTFPQFTVPAESDSPDAVEMPPVVGVERIN